MRIRGSASKLLGSASAAAACFNPSPTATASAASAEPGDEFSICELNRSPWDVMDINLCCHFLTNHEEVEDGGILVNSFNSEGEEPISAITITAAELTLQEMKEIESKKVKRKEKEIITYCKKSDGKGWHCKRLAQLPSSFCSYHLAQIRSYSSSHSHRAAADAGTGKNHKTGVGSNVYYYYNGFGPWRSKRRVGGGAGAGACPPDHVKEETKEDIDYCDNVVAGGDEYVRDWFDDGDGDEDDTLYSMPEENEVSSKKEGEMGKKRVLKKRGRKPFKCRSLKSLL